MPEEVNRRLTDHAADLLFAPGPDAEKTLEREGITEGVSVPGDVMYDTLLAIRDRLDAVTGDEPSVPDEYVLATVHRAANTDDEDRLAAIVEGLAAAPLPVVLPAHPRTAAALERSDRVTVPDAVDVIDPVGYLDFVRLLDGAERVATDSGGVQKEAFYLDTPCVTLRAETEWIETVEAGWNVLVGADADAIARNLRRRFEVAGKPRPYGDGDAAERIVDALERAVEGPPVEDAVRG
jgi:UDP-N-acetylglucosamine 2-epimerase (non-hydrolysing)